MSAPTGTRNGSRLTWWTRNRSSRRANTQSGKALTRNSTISWPTWDRSSNGEREYLFFRSRKGRQPKLSTRTAVREEADHEDVPIWLWTRLGPRAGSDGGSVVVGSDRLFRKVAIWDGDGAASHDQGCRICRVEDLSGMS